MTTPQRSPFVCQNCGNVVTFHDNAPPYKCLFSPTTLLVKPGLFDQTGDLVSVYCYFCTNDKVVERKGQMIDACSFCKVRFVPSKLESHDF